MVKLYLDLDGVMVDFDKSKERFKFRSDKEMWTHIKSIPHWFLTLDPMPDFKLLWDYLQGKYDVTILTAVPKMLPEEAAADKRAWVMNYLGKDVKIITCFGAEKQEYAQTRYTDVDWPDSNILVDDTGRNIGQWINKGGIGVLHRDAQTSIDILKELQ